MSAQIDPPPAEPAGCGAADAAVAHAPDEPMRFQAVLTRPQGQSTALAGALNDAGIGTIEFPLIEIREVEDTAALDAILADIDRHALVFFVSPNAIEHAFRRAQVLGVPLAERLKAVSRDVPPGSGPVEAAPRPAPGGWPVVAVVGPGSLRTLVQHGVRPETHRILAPEGAFDEAGLLPGLAVAGGAAGGEGDAPARVPAVPAGTPSTEIRYDSETLIRALDAQIGRGALAGRDAVIFRGDGGRELFADVLREADVRVTAVTTYQRVVPAPGEAAWQRIERLLDGVPHVWILTSSEGIRNLDALAHVRFVAGMGSKMAALKRAPVIVPHPRIAAAAVRAGFDTIATPGAGDGNVVRAVLEASERMNGTQA
jgi:uroporphyrinogen III methyltransferase/synthase